MNVEEIVRFMVDNNLFVLVGLGVGAVIGHLVRKRKDHKK